MVYEMVLMGEIGISLFGDLPARTLREAVFMGGSLYLLNIRLNLQVFDSVMLTGDLR